MPNSQPWSHDPIFGCMRFFSVLFQATIKLNKKIKVTQPNKRVIGQWIDGLYVDEYFSGNYADSLVLTNNIIKCSPEQRQHIYTINPTIYGAYYTNYLWETVDIQKDYNCFANRFDISRQSWIYQLIRRGMFDRGFISFNIDLSRIPSDNFINLTTNQAFELSFQRYNSIFKAEHDIIKNLVPYKNFEDKGDITPVILASKFSIVLETFFHNNKVITYSEKIFRCLQLPRPWVVYSSQCAVENLRAMGFDVLDDIVDHSYDLVADPIERQVAILDQCHRLLDIKINDVLSRCVQAATNNSLLLKSMQSVLLENFEQDFKNAEEQLRNL